MYNAGIAFLSVMLLGAIIYGKLWWDGPGVGLKFTKWFFGIFVLAGIVVAGITYAGVIKI
ncbi:hypothetical protein [Cohnella cholangitidis]|uniref:Uncharacterized protein n=1 Tax=Cohnella cholangitidis TaxID=2598458 RepID=A0A7G5BX10_9BACL|nr:hypothetical protein [Cohnella cholangitidis]QMV41494.1 hypothetical protein FPL14_10030 [Cohnella cholangitidis]